ncbi:MAG: DUF3127 domain-containing protein [Ferruginibacter sp.]
MKFELIGKLYVKFDTVQRTESFKTREFVIETSEENNGKTFLSYIKFQCVQDRVNIVDKINTGEQVKVYFNIRGTKWEKDGKTNYITNLDAWRLEQFAGSSSQSQAPEIKETVSNDSMSIDSATDDLPF